MSSGDRSISPDNFDWVSTCVLSLCKGCDCCQNATALLATNQIANINAHIERLEKEREVLQQTKAIHCSHHWNISYATGKRTLACSRCQAKE